jgi:alpha-beta hydrolase superfamily lysophospholipase
MEASEFELTANDGIHLHTKYWRPAAGSKAVVCLIHGLGEHSGRYAHVAKALNGAGYAVLAFDLRGHGQSGGPRGHADSSEKFLEDIEFLLAEAEKRHHGEPRFLYGHSLGGVLVLYYTLRRRPHLAGVVSTSPGLQTSLVEQKLKVTFAKTMAAILPKMTLPTNLDADLLSHDPQVSQAYRNDPLVHDRASLAMASSTIRAIEWTKEHAGEFPTPLLLIHGTDDQIAYPSGSQEFAARVSDNCTLRLWKGLYHETQNEPEKDQVIAEIIQWMDRQLK